MILFQQCHEFHQQNQILAQEIESLKEENDDLGKGNSQIELDCQHLENQAEQQLRYINCLKQLNQKTEETFQKLQIYQEELKQLLHKGRQDQGPKFDPIQFIKSVTSAQQEETLLAQELCEEEQNLSFIQELNPAPQIQSIEEEQSSHYLSINYKYLGFLAASLITVVVIKKKLL